MSSILSSFMFPDLKTVKVVSWEVVSLPIFILLPDMHSLGKYYSCTQCGALVCLLQRVNLVLVFVSEV